VSVVSAPAGSGKTVLLRSHSGLSVALRDDRWLRPSREIRLIWMAVLSLGPLIGAAPARSL
jgi:hypothetical protein